MTFDEFVEKFKELVYEYTMETKKLTPYTISIALFNGGMMPLNRILKKGGKPKYETIEKWFKDLGYEVHIAIVKKDDGLKDKITEQTEEALKHLFEKIYQIASTSEEMEPKGKSYIRKYIEEVIDDGKEAQ